MQQSLKTEEIAKRDYKIPLSSQRSNANKKAADPYVSTENSSVHKSRQMKFTILQNQKSNPIIIQQKDIRPRSKQSGPKRVRSTMPSKDSGIKIIQTTKSCNLMSSSLNRESATDRMEKMN